LAYFASYQGKAEAATWILLYYVWALSTIIPENYGSAAAVRTAHHIAQGNIPAAKSIILRTFKIVVATTCVSMTILFIFRKPLVSLLSPDETLIQMLVEIVPYLCLCEPFIAIGTVASSLNEGIGLYDSSVSVYFWVTVLVTLPSAWIFTYHFHYNIEGLASSLCIGAVVYGVINVDIFMNKKIEVEQPTMKSPLADTDVVA
jgi:Na+-driven multidrug efflux pump